uniref:Phospholipase A2 group XIIB n=1 Tax=Sus scrofa TaxID=9823 RepID=A0A8D0YAX2_PIG
MKLPTSFLILWLSLEGVLVQSGSSPDAEESYSDWGLRHIRGSFESVNSYFDSFLELLGGKNGVCQYRCRYGKAPMPRPGYKPQEPNGCSSYFLGLKVPQSMDLGIPAMTKCCNQLDVCYDTCGANKYRCDAKFRWCLHSICSDLKKSLGFVSNVEGRYLKHIYQAGMQFCSCFHTERSQSPFTQRDHQSSLALLYRTLISAS